VTTRPQLIGLPYDASSSFLRGSAAGPPLIREAIWSPAGNKFTENGSDLSGLTDAGDLALSETPAKAREQIEMGIGALLAGGFQPIALGGDHSVTYPILRAVTAERPTLTILHIDAHGDLYDDFEGDRYSHACPFARILDDCPGVSLVQVGIRTLTPHQRAQIARFDVNCIEMRHFANGARPVVDGPVYISVDMDGLDPAFAPGVSHREPGGLTVRDVLTMVHQLRGMIVGADVVEFNPGQDPTGVTAVVAAKIVREIAGQMIGGSRDLAI
jgi:agmatinase